MEHEARARFEVDDVIDVSRYLHWSSKFNPQKVKQMGLKLERKSVTPTVSGVKSFFPPMVRKDTWQEENNTKNS